MKKLKSAMIIPVPNADPVIGKWREKFDSALKGIPSHITILFPFKSPQEVSEKDILLLSEFFGSVSPFEFELYEFGTFPTVLFLEPKPREIFIKMTKHIGQQYPHYPPYGGKFAEINPHTTIASVSSKELIKTIKSEIMQDVRSKLPIKQKASEAWLMVENEDGNWEIKKKFPFNN